MYVTKIRDFVKMFRHNNLFIKYFSITLLTIIIPFLIITSIYSVYSIRGINKKSVSDSEFTAGEIASETAEAFDTLNSNYLSTATSNIVKSYLIIDRFTDAIVLSSYTDYMVSQFRSYIHNNQWINNIHLFKKSNDYVFSTVASNNLESFYDKGWYNLMTDNGMNNYIALRKYVSTSESFDCLTVTKNIYDGDYFCGTLIFNIEMPAMCEKIISSFNRVEKIYVVNDSGELVLTNDNEAIGKASASEIEKKLLTKDKKHIFTKNILPDYNLTVYLQFDNSLYINQIKSQTMLLLLILFAIIIGSTLLSYFISKQYYKNIMEIINTINNISGKSVSVINDNEFGYIYDNLYRFKDEKLSLEQKLAEKITLLKQSQLHSLQDQLSPHFLFNTLNLIIVKDQAEHKKQTNISRTVLLLSDILRFVLNSPNYLIPLRMEIMYLEKYMEIQNIKYSNNLNLSLDITDEASSATSLKFMLQPIIENSIGHGILMKKDKSGTITVSARREGENLFIDISDDGVGISFEELEKLNIAINENAVGKSEHIGLYNINNRIKLTFGEHYGLTVLPASNGFLIRITIPYSVYTDKDI